MLSTKRKPSRIADRDSTEPMIRIGPGIVKGPGGQYYFSGAYLLRAFSAFDVKARKVRDAVASLVGNAIALEMED